MGFWAWITVLALASVVGYLAILSFMLIVWLLT